MATEMTESLIAKFGTQAVEFYQKMSRENADVMPEQFLGGFIAQKLHAALECPVHVERKYSSIANELGIWTPELESQVGGWEADIAIYRDGIPSHIVELKKLGPLKVVKVDVDKAREIAKWPVSVILGLLVCEDPNRDLRSRKEDVDLELGSTTYFEEPQPSLDGKWYWCFACHSRNVVRRELAGEKTAKTAC